MLPKLPRDKITLRSESKTDFVSAAQYGEITALFDDNGKGWGFILIAKRNKLYLYLYSVEPSRIIARRPRVRVRRERQPQVENGGGDSAVVLVRRTLGPTSSAPAF